MEFQTDEYAGPRTRSVSKENTRHRPFGIALHLLFGISLVSSYLVSHARASPLDADFSWENIVPNSNLTWVGCYVGRECARLEVPLDYSDPNGEKAAVALLRVKAKVSPESKEYRGPVLFNPGGPGGSGVLQVNVSGELFQQILGDEFDILGFDPRGIGATTPAVSIFSDEADRSYWTGGEAPLINSTLEALSRGVSRANLFGELVKSRSKKAAEHVSTAVVARDMLSITKAHGRDRLQYWGVSYGTVLGATYAAMFPDNVERLVIDGVVDFDDYYSGSLSKSLLDTDKILQFFYDKCAEAGSACPMHANSSALVQQRVESIFTAIKSNPVPAVNGSDFGLVDYNLLQRGLFNSLYTPFTLLPLVAQALATLEKGDGGQAVGLWRLIQPLSNCHTPSTLGSKLEGSLAVACGEAEGVNNTIPDIIQHFNKISQDSIFADVWTDTARVSCAGWKVRAKERFAGPFTVNTSFPLLIIGNTADPVTPLVGAKKAAENFAGSVLLTVDTPGHTSEAGTSLCAKKAIRDYFANGQLPQNGTVCDIEDVLFGQKVTGVQNMTAHDAQLLEATRSLNRNLHASRGLRFV